MSTVFFRIIFLLLYTKIGGRFSEFMATNSQGNNKGKSISFETPLYRRAEKRQRDLQIKTFSQYIQRLVINDLAVGGDMVLKDAASSDARPAEMALVEVVKHGVSAAKEKPAAGRKRKSPPNRPQKSPPAAESK